MPTLIYKKGNIPWNKGIKGISEETRQKMIKNHKGNSGKKFSEETKKKMSNSAKGIKPNKESRKKMSKSLKENWNNKEYREMMINKMKGRKVWNKGIECPQFSGCNHPNWKGGITSEIMTIRHSLKYKTWRTAVFERDDYICRGCGAKGVYLEAHHIKSFSEYIDLRFLVDNGITYCQKCHALNDKYRMKTLSKKIKEKLL